MDGADDTVTVSASAASDDISPHLQQLRHSFDAIIRLLQGEGRRVRADWELVQRERDRVTRVLGALCRDRPGRAGPRRRPPDARPKGPRRDAPPVAPGPGPGRSFWIHVWPCFGTFAGSSAATARPVRLLVPGNYCFMEQLTERAGEAAGCRPAPSVLYEPDGRPIRALKNLVPEQHYLLFPSGGLYRREAVPEVLLRELVRAGRSTLARCADAE